MLRVFLLCGTFALAACATKQPPVAPTTTRSSQWTRDSVVGLTIELVDPVRYELMSFSRDGLVPITAGQKNGPMTKPLFYWKIASGRLRITIDGNILYDELTLISRDASRIVARRHSGEVVTYKIREKRNA